MKVKVRKVIKNQKTEKNDIGQYVGHSETLNDDLRKELLQNGFENPYVPGDDYDFKGDASDVRRVIIFVYKRIRGLRCNAQKRSTNPLGQLNSWSDFTADLIRLLNSHG